MEAESSQVKQTEETSPPLAKIRPPKVTRPKRVADPENWQKTIEKRARYAPKEPPADPSCDHRKGAFQCRTLTHEDVECFHGKFYSSDDKQMQDAFIIIHTIPLEPRRKSKQDKKDRFPIKYFVTRRIYSSRKTRIVKVPVCKSTFLGILRVNKNRVDGVISRFRQSASFPQENRGGNTKSHLFDDKRNAVRRFIEKFPIVESENFKGRQFLSSDLSTNKLFKIYNDEADDSLKVKRWFFFNIFSSEFNLGFAQPDK